jgi:hypothetical protein
VTSTEPTGNRRHAASGRTATLVVDDEAFDYHIDVLPKGETADLLEALAVAREWGLSAMPPEECEAEHLEDGTTRIWLVPTVPGEGK